MKAAFFEVDDREVSNVNQQCERAGIDVVKISPQSLDVVNAREIKETEILSVFLGKVDQKIIDELSNLKLISVRATGFDHVDVEHAKKRGIAVINVPTYGSQTVAEYAMTLILMLSRKMKKTILQSSRGIFDRTQIRGYDLSGKTLGIIGSGNIGKNLIKIAYGFDMKIICFDLSPDKEFCKKYCAHCVSKETLFKEADVISIHLPYTKDTHHFINADTLKQLKPGVLLVNTARGGIVDTAALMQGLDDNILGGVALDVFEGEDMLIKQDETVDDVRKDALPIFSLLKYDNVIITPHNAFNSHDAIHRMVDTALADIVAFSKKGDCSNRIV